MVEPGGTASDPSARSMMSSRIATTRDQTDPHACDGVHLAEAFWHHRQSKNGSSQ
jgi:hypothetical protein